MYITYTIKKKLINPSIQNDTNENLLHKFITSQVLTKYKTRKSRAQLIRLRNQENAVSLEVLC